jgi:DNA (cytosine-5)-methyltransferase 1
MTINRRRRVARPLPTKKSRMRRMQQQQSSRQQSQSPSLLSPSTTTVATETIHKCKIRTNPNLKSNALPPYDIELYWKKECQWWGLDRKTVIHDFTYNDSNSNNSSNSDNNSTSSSNSNTEEHNSNTSGTCIASWGVRKHVKCKWRKICDENDEEAPPSSSSEEDDDEEQQAAAATEVSVSVLSPDEEQLDEISTLNTSTKGGMVEEHDDDNDDNSDKDNGLVTNNSHDWWDYSSDESDYSNDEDYCCASVAAALNKQRIHPCDATSVTFDNNIQIHKGGIYEQRCYDDDGGEKDDDDDGSSSRRIVKILEFTGKKLPIRKAKCQIICYMHCAIQDCFPNAIMSTTCGIDDDDDNDTGTTTSGVKVDRTVVMETTVKGERFLKTLVETDEDFDVLSTLVEYDLKRDRGNKLIAQFTNRRHHHTSSVAAVAAAGDYNNVYTKERSGGCTTSSNPKELVLFAGIGGCSIGDESAGFDVKWLVDKDSLAAASLSQCHPDARIYNEDVSAFLDNCTVQRPGYPKRGDVDHIQGSSPCNGFSKMNIYGGRDDYKNNRLCHEQVRATQIFLPRTGMFENVTGMLDATNVHHIIKMTQDLLRLKYQVRVAIHNSIDYGVPQSRKRVIITLSRGDVPMPQMPTPTCHSQESFATLGDAIGDLQSIDCELDRHRSGLVQLPCGGLTFNHVARVTRKSSKTLNMNEPVATITTSNSFKHPTVHHRTLSVREYARLFGLPDSLQLFGSFTQIRQHIGNAVPPPLARSISIPIRRVYEGNFDDEESKMNDE